jgi:large conductance mechanosensitive channel
MKAINDFKAFILRGNVVDLAVGIVIGVAFGTVVTALVKDLITPLIAAIGKQPDFASWYFTVHGSRFLIGDFINAVVSFVILAAAVFFFVVRPVNALIQRSKTEPPPDPTTRDCPYCLSIIPIQATKCMYCTSDVPPVEEAVDEDEEVGAGEEEEVPAAGGAEAE